MARHFPSPSQIYRKNVTPPRIWSFPMQFSSKSIFVTMSACVLFLSVSPEAYSSDDGTILIANYYAKVAAGEQIRIMKAQAHVRDRSGFPIQFDDYKVLVSLSKISSKQYLAELTVQENLNERWTTINSDALSFKADFSTPIEFVWQQEKYSLEFVISVAIDQ